MIGSLRCLCTNDHALPATTCAGRMDARSAGVAAVPMTRDHTPEEVGESERVLACGVSLARHARVVAIMSASQLTGWSSQRRAFDDEETRGARCLNESVCPAKCDAAGPNCHLHARQRTPGAATCVAQGSQCAGPVVSADDFVYH